MPIRNTSCDVLVVDDDDDCRSAEVMLLEAQGLSTQSASSGDAALALMRSGLTPSMVLLDFQMPGMNGQATLAALHADRTLLQPMVVLVTGESHPPQLDVVAVVRKPVRTGEVLRVVLPLTAKARLYLAFQREAEDLLHGRPRWHTASDSARHQYVTRAREMR